MFLVSSMLSDQWITFSVAVVAIFVMLSSSSVVWFGAAGPGSQCVTHSDRHWHDGLARSKIEYGDRDVGQCFHGLAVDFSIHYLTVSPRTAIGQRF